MTPQESMAAYLAELAGQRRLSPHTLAAYRRDLENLLRTAKELPLEQIQGLHIRRFIGALHGGGLSPRSLARVLSAWRGFFDWLGERGLVAANPCSGIRAPKAARRLPKALSVDEAARLMSTPEVASPVLEARDTAMCELFYSSGLRLAELLALDLVDLPTERQHDALSLRIDIERPHPMKVHREVNPASRVLERNAQHPLVMRPLTAHALAVYE
jgi:integrase/recombinase XerC